METIIKQHIEERCKENEALCLNYEESGKNIADCCEYITEEARKYLKNRNGAIADEIVFGWAVHYFVEKLYKTRAEEKARKEAERIARQKKQAQKIKSNTEVIKETGKRTPDKMQNAPIKPVEAPVQPKAEKPANNLLFDFDEL